jgi:hypothetical protein
MQCNFNNPKAHVKWMLCYTTMLLIKTVSRPMRSRSSHVRIGDPALLNVNVFNWTKNVLRFVPAPTSVIICRDLAHVKCVRPSVPVSQNTHMNVQCSVSANALPNYVPIQISLNQESKNSSLPNHKFVQEPVFMLAKFSIRMILFVRIVESLCLCKKVSGEANLLKFKAQVTCIMSLSHKRLTHSSLAAWWNMPITPSMIWRILRVASCTFRAESIFAYLRRNKSTKVMRFYSTTATAKRSKRR